MTKICQSLVLWELFCHNLSSSFESNVHVIKLGFHVGVQEIGASVCAPFRTHGIECLVAATFQLSGTVKLFKREAAATSVSNVVPAFTPVQCARRDARCIAACTLRKCIAGSLWRPQGGGLPNNLQESSAFQRRQYLCNLSRRKHFCKQALCWKIGEIRRPANVVDSFTWRLQCRRPVKLTK